MRKSREAKLPAGPDGFVGAAAASGKYGPGETAATRSMYSYISQGLLATKPADLPRKGRARRRKGAAHATPRKNRRVLGESIEKRPAEAASRERFGDWECDLVEGARGGDGCALLAMAERKTRKYIMRLLPGKGSQAAKAGVAAVFAEYGAAAFRTLTFDNGSEFAEMAGLCSGIGAAAYFTHPYSSWEKAQLSATTSSQGWRRQRARALARCPLAQ
jgi:IS30 family transposase